MIPLLGSRGSSGLLLPAEAFPDFSHGFEPLGQTAAAIGPLTFFHEWSGGSQASLRKPVHTEYQSKTQYRARADAGLYQINAGTLLQGLLYFLQNESRKRPDVTEHWTLYQNCVSSGCDFV